MTMPRVSASPLNNISDHASGQDASSAILLHWYWFSLSTAILCPPSVNSIFIGASLSMKNPTSLAFDAEESVRTETRIIPICPLSTMHPPMSLS